MMPRSHVWFRVVLFAGLLFSSFGTGACSPSDAERDPKTKTRAIEGADVPAAPSPSANASGIRADDIMDHEKAWPDIAVLVEPWTPAGADAPLKQGYRGAVIRVLENGHVRIDFGRHGKHEIPIAATDLILRANEVAAGSRHKVAPNFLAHFGTQFVHPTTAELVAMPTPELAKSERFLCVFADPSLESFAELAERLATLDDVPKLQALMFPLAVERNQVQTVKDRLQAVGWPVPFAYPQAAEKHAESLLDEIPTAPTALLVTSEGRLLHRTTLSEPGAIDALRAAATPPSP